MAYFEKLKVAPPLTINRIEETIKLLKEKREYYSGLPLTDNIEVKTEEKGEKKPQENHKVIK